MKVGSKKNLHLFVRFLSSRFVFIPLYSGRLSKCCRCHFKTVNTIFLLYKLIIRIIYSTIRDGRKKKMKVQSNDLSVMFVSSTTNGFLFYGASETTIASNRHGQGKHLCIPIVVRYYRCFKPLILIDISAGIVARTDREKESLVAHPVSCNWIDAAVLATCS